MCELCLRPHDRFAGTHCCRIEQKEGYMPRCGIKRTLREGLQIPINQEGATAVREWWSESEIWG
jgi:hypothetical protein